MPAPFFSRRLRRLGSDLHHPGGLEALWRVYVVELDSLADVT